MIFDSRSVYKINVNSIKELFLQLVCQFILKFISGLGYKRLSLQFYMETKTIF